MSLHVLDPGLLATIQDRGRIGYAHLGVPRAGAVDRGAAALANRLVGNPPDAALVELTLSGGRFRLGRGHTIAVTGAPAAIAAGGRRRAFAEPLSLPAGADVSIGPAERGVRTYVAIAGGIDVPPILGSRSTDTLGGLGPAPLRAGDEVAVGAPSGVPAPHDTAHDRLRSAPDERVGLYRGPRWDWIDAGSREALVAEAYTVAPDSDRVALRLSGMPLTRSGALELPSEGILWGAVQVPPRGQPLIFLADHPVTGGYPVVAVVAEADLDRCAQLRPGEGLRFRWLD